MMRQLLLGLLLAAMVGCSSQEPPKKVTSPMPTERMRPKPTSTS
jgi:hypothetical protein